MSRKSNNTFSIQLIGLALLILWVYAGVSKLQEVEVFEAQLRRQPFPDSWAAWLVWMLPGVELGVAGLLVFGRTRGAGLWGSLGLLVVFTGYLGLAVAGVWAELPCACGGILSHLGWEEHLLLNGAYTCLAGAGVVLWTKKRSGASGGDAASGEAAYRSGGR